MAESKISIKAIVKDTYRKATLKNLYPSRYRAACKASVIPGRVVFLEIREKALTDNFKMIRAAMEKWNEREEGADVQAQDTRSQSTKAQDVKSQSTKAQDEKSQSTKAQDEKSQSTKAQDEKSQSTKAQDAKSRNTKAQDVKSQKPSKFTWSMEVISIGEGMENRGAVMKNCLKAIPQLARAQFIFVNEVSYFLSCLPIRPETTVIQTWHGCGAFKKFGYSTVGQGFGTTREDLEAYPVHGNFSYVTVSAPEVVWAYAEAFHMEDRVERILPIGVSRTDMFFSRKYRERACQKTAWVLRRMAPQLFLKDEKSGRYSVGADDGYGAGAEENKGVANQRLSHHEIYSRIGDVYSDRAEDRQYAEEMSVVPGRKILLYAPTFRGSVGRAVAPQALDIPTMKTMLGKDYVLLINHHPFIKTKDRPKIPQSCRDFAFDMTDHLAIEELLTAADICITDYSSLIFEYSLFEKPMVFFAYDMENYLDERGFYYPVSEMMPGPVCRTTRELVDVLREKDAEFDLTRVREFKYRFMSGCDGHATARLMKLLEKCMK